MNKFDKAEERNDRMVFHIMEQLPGVSDIERREEKDRIDYNFKSGGTQTCLESKYRKGHIHTEYRDVRIQRDKWLYIKKNGGFLLQIFEDSWWLWYLGDTEPCDEGEWTHCKHTVENDGKITDGYVAFSYKDALYHFIKK